MNNLSANLQAGLQSAWANLMLFAPKLLLALVVVVAGYFVAKILCKVLDKVLERVGFDRLVERGGLKRAMAKTHWDASDILAKTVFYFVMLFALQLGFGVFGPNPVSDLLTRIVAYLPNIFVASIIIVIAGAIAAAVKNIITATLGGLNYGRILATAAAVTIWVVGIFAALNQLQIAPEIVNGLFYAILAAAVGSLIVAVGGGGIVPMRRMWERAMGRIEEEAPRIKAEANAARQRLEATGVSWPEHHDQAHHSE